MSTTVPAIRSVKARAVVAPIARSVKNAFGIIEAAPLVLIDVATDQGVIGHSYIFGYSRLALKPLVGLVEEIGRDLTGRAVAPFDLMASMDAKFRLLGWQGLVGMAVSGLDMAFWDALGQLGGKPLVELLGGSARPMTTTSRLPWTPMSTSAARCRAVRRSWSTSSCRGETPTRTEASPWPFQPSAAIRDGSSESYSPVRIESTTSASSRWSHRPRDSAARA